MSAACKVGRDEARLGQHPVHAPACTAIPRCVACSVPAQRADLPPHSRKMPCQLTAPFLLAISHTPAEEVERRDRQLVEARKELEELHPQLERYKAWVSGELISRVIVCGLRHPQLGGE